MKPGDFLLGVLDFFAVLLPGSLATWLVVQYLPPATLRAALAPAFLGPNATPNDLVLATAFLISSYLLGHFVFMAGSKLDPSYDRWRKRIHPHDRDKAFQAAKKLQETVTPELADGEFSTLKWAKTYITVNAGNSHGEIDRLEADHKFFRSLVVVAGVFALHFLLKEQAPVAAMLSIVMSVLSYMRYRERRWQMTELIFATAVIVATRHQQEPPAGS